MRPVCFERSLAHCGELPSPPAPYSNSSHPSCPHPWPGEPEGCRLLQLDIPTAASNMLCPGDHSHGTISQNFFTFLPQNSCFTLLFPSLHLPTPQHQAQVLPTPYLSVPLPPLSQERASGYRSLKSSPTEPLLGTLTNTTVSIQRSPRTRNGHRSGPCLLGGGEDQVLERAVGSRRAAGGEWVPLGEEAAGTGEGATGPQKPQEGSVLGRTCKSTSSVLEVLPGSRIYNARDPPTLESHAAVSYWRQVPQSCQSSPC